MEQLTMARKSTKAISKNYNHFFEKKNPLPFFAAPVIQPKLTVNQPNDIYEQEADAVADRVMRMEDTSTPGSVLPSGQPLSKIQRHCASCEEEQLQRMEDDEEELVQLQPAKNFDIQRKCAACEEEDAIVQTKLMDGFVQRKCSACSHEEEKIQRKEDDEDEMLQMQIAGNLAQRKCAACDAEEHKIYRKESAHDAPSVTASVRQAIASTGQPMDKSTRSFMEQRFGYDFGRVQIHDNPLSHQSSAEINAFAYTHGDHIIFSLGKYQPGTENGKRLLAHELTHVLQQGQAVRSKQVIQPFTAAERNIVQRITAEEQDSIDNPLCPTNTKEDPDPESEKLRKTPFWELNYSNSIPTDLTQLPREDNKPLFKDFGGACSFCPKVDLPSDNVSKSDTDETKKKIAIITDLPPIPKLSLPPVKKKQANHKQGNQAFQAAGSRTSRVTGYDLTPLSKIVTTKYNRGISKNPSALERKNDHFNNFISEIGNSIHDLIVEGMNLQYFILGNSIGEKTAVKNFMAEEYEQTTSHFDRLITTIRSNKRSTKNNIDNRYVNNFTRVINSFNTQKDLFTGIGNVASDGLFTDWGTNRDQLFKTYDFASTNMKDIYENAGDKAMERANIWGSIYQFALGWPKAVKSKVDGDDTDGFFTGAHHTQDTFYAMSDTAVKVGAEYQSGMQKQAGTSSEGVDCRRWSQLDAINQAYREVIDGLSFQKDNGSNLLSNSATLNNYTLQVIQAQTFQLIEHTYASTESQLKLMKDWQLNFLYDSEQQMLDNIDDNARKLRSSVFEGITNAADFLIPALDALSGRAIATIPDEEEMEMIQKIFNEGVHTGRMNLFDIQRSFITGLYQNASSFRTGVHEKVNDNQENALILKEKYTEFSTETQYDAQRKFGQIYNNAKFEFGEIIKLYDIPFKTMRSILNNKINSSLVNIKASLCDKLINTDKELQKVFKKTGTFDKTVVNAAQKTADQQLKAYQRSAGYVKMIIIGFIVGVSIVLSAGLLAPAAVGLLTLGEVVIAMAVIGALSNALIRISSNILDGKPIFQGVLKDTLIGGITGIAGALGGALLSKAGTVIGFIGNIAMDVGTNIVIDLVNGNNITLQGILLGAAIGIGVGVILHKLLSNPAIASRFPKLFGETMNARAAARALAGEAGGVEAPIVMQTSSENNIASTEVHDITARNTNTDVNPRITSPREENFPVNAETSVANKSSEINTSITGDAATLDISMPPTKAQVNPELPVADELDLGGIPNDNPLAKKDTLDGHEAVASPKGVGKCSPSPCPLLRVEYAEEIKNSPELKDWEQSIQDLRTTDPAAAVEEADQFIRTAEAARANAKRSVARGSNNDDLHFTLDVSDTRARKIMVGEKDFVIDRGTNFDVDEVLPVGASDITPQEARRRALDSSNRQLLDAHTNRSSKGLGTDARELASNRQPKAPISVTDDPSALITRRFNEVNELENIFNKAVSSVKNPQSLTPTELKAAVNKETRRIIAEDLGADAVAVREALTKLGFEYVQGKGFTMLSPPDMRGVVTRDGGIAIR